ncbi:MAG: hypothetical protein JXR10_15450 [Cyclobacteriaceae bacterium]
MKYLLAIALLSPFLSLRAQSDDGMTNILIVPVEFQNMSALEEVLETMKVHEAVLDIKRSAMVMTPFGPSKEYKEVIEIHFKSMSDASEWREQMEKKIPEERRKLLAGVINIFYPYRPDKE